MPSRFAAGLIAVAALLGSVGLAHSQDSYQERLEMLNTGPKGHSLGFNGSNVTRTTVNYTGDHKPGTIVVDTGERRLYLVQAGGTALRYGIGVGRVGFTWKGVRKVTDKKEWPGWTPPPQMLKRQPNLPRHMAGGIDNPLGARALYLGGTLYRIHGSNEPETIGHAVSSGCFRMTNEDVTDLYSRVPVGTTVVVQ
jgi:lipoprotein-anchoring transpeptidase ErfK/SrfK